MYELVIVSKISETEGLLSRVEKTLKDANATEVKIEKEQPIFEEVLINISFTEYLNNINNYDKQAVTLTGFLSREIVKSGNSGVYMEYIIDDLGNKITLLNLIKQQIALFPNKRLWIKSRTCRLLNNQCWVLIMIRQP